MPSFCRHNRLVINCPICSREQAAAVPPAARAPRKRPAARPTAARARPAGPPALALRQPRRAPDDGYRNPLVPGIKATVEARRFAVELARAADFLDRLASDPPGPYAEVAAEPDREEATWLAFLLAYFAPDDDAGLLAVARGRPSWASGEVPDPDALPRGRRTSHDPARGARTLAAYRAWAARAGSQVAGFEGDPGWTPERRFARVLERLALPGFGRAGRYELLATLAATAVHPLRAATLALATGDDDATTTGAKRAFLSGDPLLLERRAAALADAAEVPIAALDRALDAWERAPARAPEPDEVDARAAAVMRVLGVA